jgi:hypothetical protein
MDDPGLVGSSQTLRDLRGDLKEFLHRQRPVGQQLP